MSSYSYLYSSATPIVELWKWEYSRVYDGPDRHKSQILLLASLNNFNLAYTLPRCAKVLTDATHARQFVWSTAEPVGNYFAQDSKAHLLLILDASIVPWLIFFIFHEYSNEGIFLSTYFKNFICRHWSGETEMKGSFGPWFYISLFLRVCVVGIQTFQVIWRTPYLAGEKYTLADITGFLGAKYAEMMVGLELPAAGPVAGWIDKVVRRDSASSFYTSLNLTPDFMEKFTKKDWRK